MKINIKFIVVEGIRETFGDPEFAFELRGSSAGDLVRELMGKYGKKSEEIFFRDGRYNANLQIIINWRKYVKPERMDDFMLQEGDTVIFTHLVEGG